MAPVWRGTKSLTPGKQRWKYSPTKETVEISYSGPFTACQTNRPAIGSTITGFPAYLIVIGAEIEDLGGGAARLDISIEAQLDPSQFSWEAIGSPTYETEWAELQKPIETHPRCGVLNPARSYYKDGLPCDDASQGGKQRTWEDWSYLIGAVTTVSGQTAQPDYITTGVTVPPGWGSEVAWELSEYKQLKNAGVESYVLFQPVIRRTTYHLSPPDDLGDQSGKGSNPPSAANFTNIEGYLWLQGPDRCTKTKGIFCRSTEWQGFEPNDNSSLIYQGT